MIEVCITSFEDHKFDSLYSRPTSGIDLKILAYYLWAKLVKVLV